MIAYLNVSEQGWPNQRLIKVSLKSIKVCEIDERSGCSRKSWCNSAIFNSADKYLWFMLSFLLHEIRFHLEKLTSQVIKWKWCDISWFLSVVQTCLLNLYTRILYTTKKVHTVSYLFVALTRRSLLGAHPWECDCWENCFLATVVHFPMTGYFSHLLWLYEYWNII